MEKQFSHYRYNINYFFVSYRNPLFKQLNADLLMRWSLGRGRSLLWKTVLHLRPALYPQITAALIGGLLGVNHCDNADCWHQDPPGGWWHCPPPPHCPTCPRFAPPAPSPAACTSPPSLRMSSFRYFNLASFSSHPSAARWRCPSPPPPWPACPPACRRLPSPAAEQFGPRSSSPAHRPPRSRTLRSDHSPPPPPRQDRRTCLVVAESSHLGVEVVL